MGADPNQNTQMFNVLDETPVQLGPNPGPTGTNGGTPNAYANNANPNTDLNDRRWQGPELLNNNYMDPMNDYMNSLRSQTQGGAQNNPWMRYQMQQEQERQGQDMQNLENAGQSGVASQQQNMAMRGGMTSGASGRMNRTNIMGQLMGQQNLREGAASREAGIKSESETRHNALTGQLNNMEMQSARFGAEVDMWNAEQTNRDNAAKYASESGHRNA